MNPKLLILLSLILISTQEDISSLQIDETEAKQWKYLDYNPFADSFPKYIEDNSKYIVDIVTESNKQCRNS